MPIERLRRSGKGRGMSEYTAGTRSQNRRFDSRNVEGATGQRLECN